MSELIHKNDNRQTIRWKLLTGASAMALTAYVASTALARAEDSDRPTLWIELGGQMELMQGLDSPFTAPFMTAVSPTPDVYKGGSFADDQRPPRFAFGGDGKISFQPQDSDWIFSASIRYGRSHAARHAHHQTPGPSARVYSFAPPPHATIGTETLPTAAFRDDTTRASEHHMVLDFTAGKDVGIGLLGRNGTSTLGGGVRLVDFTAGAATAIYARPVVNVVYPGPKYNSPNAAFHAYTMKAHAARSFKGIGPSLYWNASAALAGNKHDGELTVDWGVDASLLFGRQKAKTDHSTQAYQRDLTQYRQSVRYGTLYPLAVHDNPLRSRLVTIPNLGGSVGLSVKYPNVKVSVGYRTDVFFNAMDTGVDALKKSNLTFQGPYASISIGLGD